jgi:hypothetical protein
MIQAAMMGANLMGTGAGAGAGSMGLSELLAQGIGKGVGSGVGSGAMNIGSIGGSSGMGLGNMLQSFSKGAKTEDVTTPKVNVYTAQPVAQIDNSGTDSFGGYKQNQYMVNMLQQYAKSLPTKLDYPSYRGAK